MCVCNPEEKRNIGEMNQIGGMIISVSHPVLRQDNGIMIDMNFQVSPRD